MAWQDQRDRILFGLGILGICAEFALWLVKSRPPDLTFTAAFCAMVGLPTVIRGDSKKP